jgi:hypothetical protein
VTRRRNLYVSGTSTTMATIEKMACPGVLFGVAVAQGGMAGVGFAVCRSLSWEAERTVSGESTPTRCCCLDPTNLFRKEPTVTYPLA